MSEAVAEQAETEIVSEEQQAPVVAQANESPETPQENEQKIQFSEEQQNLINDIVGKKTFKIREAERQTEELRKQLEETKAQLPRDQRPSVPDIPDPYDTDFQTKVAVRDKAIEQAAQFDARQQIQNSQMEADQARKTQAQLDTLKKSVDSYAQRAKQLGMNNEELQQAGSVVAQYGINDDLVRHILSDSHGPLITKYLASNPIALDEIAKSDPLRAAVLISTDIKAKAVKLATKTTSAPPPTQALSGAGVPPTRRGPKGASFK